MPVAVVKWRYVRIRLEKRAGLTRWTEPNVNEADSDHNGTGTCTGTGAGAGRVGRSTAGS